MGDMIAYITVGVFGGICLIAIVIIVVCVLKRKQLKKKREASEIQQLPVNPSQEEQGIPMMSSGTPLPPWMDYGDSFQFKIPRPDKYTSTGHISSISGPNDKAFDTSSLERVNLDKPHYPPSLHA
jgi:hypothetical protein